VRDILLKAEKTTNVERKRKTTMQQQQQYQQQQGSLVGYNNKMNVLPNYTLSGMSSFDAESLPDYSEFDSESVTLDYYKERYIRESKQYAFCFASVSPEHTQHTYLHL